MDSLTKIGAVLFIFGLLVFGLRLMTYNRKKYQLDTRTDEAPGNYISPRSVIRILSVIIFLVALLILAFGPR